VEIEVRKHMDDQSVAQRQSSSLGKSSFAALTVLAVCFMLSMLGRGLSESFTVFLLPISRTFGWNRGQIISIYSLASLASALASPLVGRMFDHFGPRVVYSLGLIVLGGAFLVAAYGQQLWQFQLSLGLCVGSGITSIGTVPNSILLGRWFGQRLPTAMAVVYSAGGAGVLMLLPVSQLLIDHVGWRGAYQVFGEAVLLLLVPLLLLPWKRFTAGSPALGKAAAADLLDDSWTLRRAIRHHTFWGLFSTFFFTWDVLNLGAGRGLSRRYRIFAAASCDNMGIQRRGPAVRHVLDYLARRHHRPPPFGVVQLCPLDFRNSDALAVKKLSQRMVVDRIRGLVRRHDRLARAADLGDRD
jgi:MFS family permease